MQQPTPTMEGDMLERKISKEQISERIMEHAMGLRGKISLLLRAKEKIPNYIPSPEEFLQLAPKDQSLALELLGRYNFGLYSMNNARKSWADAVGHECEEISSGAENSDKLATVVDRLAELSGLYIATEDDTNTYGDKERFQDVYEDSLVEMLAKSGSKEGVEKIINPFHLKKGDVMYRPKWEDREQILQRIELGEVVFDGKDSVVDIGGETVMLRQLNFELGTRQLILRDGSSYFGGMKYDNPLAGIEKNAQIKFSYNLPTGEIVYKCQYLGTNEDELRGQYGEAYYPYLKKMLVVKVLHDSKETEISLDGATLEIEAR